MGELVECSCDKNLVRHNVLLNSNMPGGGGSGGSNSNSPITTFETTRANNKKNRNKMPRRNGNKQPRNPNKRKAPPQVPDFPGMGETWEWSGCDDNVNFGNRKSKDFLDSRFRRRSDIRTLVKLQNNDAGRLVSSTLLHLSTLTISSIFFSIT